MATYTERPYSEAPLWGPKGIMFGWRCTTRVYANGDIVQIAKVQRGNKIISSGIATADEMDTNAAPTMTSKLRLYDGTTEIILVTATAVQHGTTGGFVQYANVPAGFAYVVPTAGFRLEWVVTAALATAATGIVRVMVNMTGLCFGGEDFTAPS